MNIKTPAALAADAPETTLTVIPAVARNPVGPLDRAAFESRSVNLSAAQRRAASLGARRSVKKQWQAAWLVNAIRCIDLTTLAGDDTAERVRRLCAKARQPCRPKRRRRWVWAGCG
jgi:deoxyribose-phosphate aldolase